MTSPEQENPSALTLTSPDLPGGTFPREFTCDGANRRPRLEWGAPPPGTQELAIEMLDPDAPGGTFTHWLVYGMPPGISSLAAVPSGAAEGVNDFGRRGYGGPCPPYGAAHHYHLVVVMDDITSLRRQLPFCGRMVDLRAARSPGRDGLKALRVSDLEHSFEDWCRSWSRQGATWRDRLRRAYVWSPLGRWDPRLPSLPGLSPAGRRLVTIAVSSAALAAIQPAFAGPELLALAGFLAGSGVLHAA